MSARTINPYVALAVVSGVALLFAQWWLTSGARYVTETLHDAAPEGATGLDLVVAGTAGTIGDWMGLPTPRQIAENPQLCQTAGTWFDASLNCGVPDLWRWMRGDFNDQQRADRPFSTMPVAAPADYKDVTVSLWKNVSGY